MGFKGTHLIVLTVQNGRELNFLEFPLCVLSAERHIVFLDVIFFHRAKFEKHHCS